MEIILRALEIGLGDEVIIPSYTFIATSSAVLAAGATPVFCDIDENSFNMDPAQIEPSSRHEPKAIIPVHIGGNLCDMDAIGKIANRHGLYVIEDAAHAHGSEWKGQRAGTLGIAGSFSMQGSKTLSAGEGGMIVTNDRDLYHRCFSVHHCGRDAVNPDWYDHPYLGTNARMTEWQAAVLRQQLRRLDNQIETRMKKRGLAGYAT